MAAMDRRELRQYEAWKAEAQFLRDENRYLRQERDVAAATPTRGVQRGRSSF